MRIPSQLLAALATILVIVAHLVESPLPVTARPGAAPHAGVARPGALHAALTRPHAVHPVAAPSTGQTTPARQLLARSIAYHDPDGLWSSAALRFDLAMGHSDWWNREVDLLIDNARGVLEARMRWKGDLIEVARRGGAWTRRLNGSEQIDRELLDHHDLLPEELDYWANYFLFVFGLPMKLTDPGVILDPEPLGADFRGREVLALRVTFEPEVGTDVWFLFLDPESARLVGCRFFHDEAARDGDTMVFEDEVVAGSLRLPKHRTWYSNADGSLRGTDTIESIRIVER